MTERVGFIGLGAIGEPMAKHIDAAFETVVWNRTSARAKSFAKEARASVAASPRDLVASVDAVITCLPTSKEVLEVVNSVGDAWREGQLLVDATSGDPAGSRTAAEQLGHRGVGFVDAPVSGGTSGARAGKLTVMLGGDEPWVSRAKKLVAPYAGKIEHVGSVGAAHAVKAVNQALLAVNIQAVAEGLAALVKFGVKAGAALDVINASTGRSNVTENLFPKRVVTREWPRTFRLALLDKDVGIALKMLEDLNIPHEAFRVARRFCAEARQALGEEADHVEAVKEIEQAAGVQIK
jgi:3-hydroxyisobutyrate dehydrogenase